MAPMSVPGSGDEPDVTPQAPAAHYFSPGPGTPSRPATVHVDLPGRSFELATDAGTFSPGRLDPGTRVLLESLPPLTVGPVVDVGCGYGPIACAVALAHPTLEVLAVDVNERARSLCERNAAALGADVRVLSPEQARSVDRVGTIVSNPPIRIGKAALHDLLADWLDRLTSDGVALLVVHKNLGADSLARWLAERGHPTARLRSRRGYRVLEVRPRP